MSTLSDLLAQVNALPDLPATVVPGPSGHPKLHNDERTLLGKLRLLAVALAVAAVAAAGGSSGGSSTTTPPPTTGGSGTDQRTQVEFATGAPTKPASMAVTSPITLLSGMAGTDGVIRLDRLWIVSTDFNTPCILCNCGSTPIVLTNLVLIGAGRIIQAGTNTNITATDVAAYGTDFNVDGSRTRVRAFDFYKPINVVFKYFTVETGGGFYVDHYNGNRSAGQQLVFTNGKGRNMIGSNGQNGAGDYRSFIQISTADVDGQDKSVPLGQLNWLECWNEPNKARVEDQINIYNTSGLTGVGWFLGNGLPYPATATQYTGAAVSIDGDGGTVGSSYNTFTDIYVNGGGNAACNIAIGQHNTVRRIHAVSAGFLADGTRTQSGYSGLAVIDYYQTGSVLDNHIVDAEVGWTRTKDTVARLDVAPVSQSGAVVVTTTIPDPLTLETERQNFLKWVALLNANNQTVGSRYVPS